MTNQSCQSSGVRRVFSGVQPSGKIHIGNYIGALSQWKTMQDNYDSIYCIVDLHSITVPQDVRPEQLREKIREVAALYLACGIDHELSAIFVQSHVHEHAELTWLLNCITPLGWLERMTQYKAKAARLESIGTGLLDYPVLMASDILLYDTHLVPVGDDQKQHVELTRNIAQRFNSLFGDVFVIPEPLIRESGARIMGLDDPEVKMSKSIGNEIPGHTIGLLDDERTVKSAIMSAKTDSGSVISFTESGPGVRNLLVLLEVLSGQSKDDIERQFEGKGYGHLKKALLEAVLETLRPIQERYQEIRNDSSALERILQEGADRVRPRAQKKVQAVKEAIGVG